MNSHVLPINDWNKIQRKKPPVHLQASSDVEPWVKHACFMTFRFNHTVVDFATVYAYDVLMYELH